MLESVGFGEDMRGASIASLSGGWKMKLALGELRALPAHTHMSSFNLNRARLVVLPIALSDVAIHTTMMHKLQLSSLQLYWPGLMYSCMNISPFLICSKNTLCSCAHTSSTWYKKPFVSNTLLDQSLQVPRVCISHCCELTVLASDITT